jgi:hypothetical protein
MKEVTISLTVDKQDYMAMLKLVESNQDTSGVLEHILDTAIDAGLDIEE